jgi:hypothetical protein
MLIVYLDSKDRASRGRSFSSRGAARVCGLLRANCANRADSAALVHLAKAAKSRSNCRSGCPGRLHGDTEAHDHSATRERGSTGSSLSLNFLFIFQSVAGQESGEGCLSDPSPPPLAPAKAFFRSGCGRIFSLFSRVMRDGLSTGPASRMAGRRLSGPIFSGPLDCAHSVQSP